MTDYIAHRLNERQYKIQSKRYPLESHVVTVSPEGLAVDCSGVADESTCPGFGRKNCGHADAAEVAWHEDRDWRTAQARQRAEKVKNAPPEELVPDSPEYKAKQQKALERLGEMPWQ